MIQRYAHNPILTAADVPYPVATVHNAGAVKHEDRYLLLFRSHRRNGRSVIGLAESDDGYDFKVRPEPFLLPATEGVFAETAGGVTLAATKKLIAAGKIDRDSRTVVCITGNGLKTAEALAGHTASVHRIKPNLASFEDVLNAIGR